MNSVAFTIGTWPVYWYGIIISSALILGVFLAQHLARRRGYDLDRIWTIFMITIPSAVIGARLYYVLFSLENYLADPITIFMVWRGGLAVHGAILGGLLAVYLCCRAYRMDTFGILDCLAPAVALGQAIGRWGNFVNHEAYGAVTTLPWGIHVQADSFLHHPTFLYESIWDFLLVITLLILFSKVKRSGNIFCLYLLIYSVGRFFIEGLRMDSLMIGPFRQAQVISICLILVAAAILVWRNRKDSTVPYLEPLKPVQLRKK